MPLPMSPTNKNTLENWDNYFANGWEQNDGPKQTRLFANFFLQTVHLPKDAHSLLDVGCAMGDALAEIHKAYPNLVLNGCDISVRAITAAKHHFGDIAGFKLWDFQHIKGFYDIIYCSNVLEHFESYELISQLLLSHCRWLYVLVPYKEYKAGKPLTVEPDQWHVATFDKHSFDGLVSMGVAKNIRTWVRYTPDAWGGKPPQLHIRILNFLIGIRGYVEFRQIFYEITSTAEAEVF